MLTIRNRLHRFSPLPAGSGSVCISGRDLLRYRASKGAAVLTIHKSSKRLFLDIRASNLS